VRNPPARPIYPGTYFGTAGSALIRAASLWDDLEAAACRHQGRLEDAGRRLTFHQRDRDRADARRPRQDGRTGRGRCGSSTYLGRIIILVDDDIDITTRPR